MKKPHTHTYEWKPLIKKIFSAPQIKKTLQLETQCEDIYIYSIHAKRQVNSS